MTMLVPEQVALLRLRTVMVPPASRPLNVPNETEQPAGIAVSRMLLKTTRGIVPSGRMSPLSVAAFAHGLRSDMLPENAEAVCEVTTHVPTHAEDDR
jgi:hypothetical protein